MSSCILCNQSISQDQMRQVSVFADDEPSSMGTRIFRLVPCSTSGNYSSVYSHEKCAALSREIPRCISCNQRIDNWFRTHSILHPVTPVGDKAVVFKHVGCSTPPSFTTKVASGSRQITKGTTKMTEPAKSCPSSCCAPTVPGPDAVPADLIKTETDTGAMELTTF